MKIGYTFGAIPSLPHQNLRKCQEAVNGPNGKLVTNDQGCSDKRKPKTQRQPSALNYDLLSIFDKSPVKDANSREAIS